MGKFWHKAARIAFSARTAGNAQCVEQPRRSFISHTQTLSTGLIAESTGDPTFPSAGRPGDVKIVARANPVAGNQHSDEAAIESALVLIINVFYASALTQASQLQEPSLTTALAIGSFPIHQHRQAFIER